MKSTRPFYDINVMIWENETGEFSYSVIQEFNEQGTDQEVLVSGSVGSLAEALNEARYTILEALT